MRVGSEVINAGGNTWLHGGVVRAMRMTSGIRAAIALVIVGMALGACTTGSQASPTVQPGASPGCGPETPSPTPIATGCRNQQVSAPELRLLLIDRFGPRWYCDPDFYPIAVQDEMARMRDRWPDIVADAEALTAILAHEGLGSVAVADLTDQQRLAVYRLWKVLNSIQLDPIGNDRYRFDYLAQPVAGATEGTRTTGTIDDTGAITVEQQAGAGEPPCPICLSVGTRIDTPDGPIAVERLRLGDPVWTLDGAGRRIAGTVIALGSTPAPAGHQVIRLVLQDGRTVTASPGHPLPDGRLVGDLQMGDLVDGSRVVTADLMPYLGDETYDLVASGPTRVYLAGGIPLGSTLR